MFIYKFLILQVGNKKNIESIYLTPMDLKEKAERGPVFSTVQTSVLTPNSACFIVTCGSDNGTKHAAFQRAHATAVLSPKTGLLYRGEEE